jgi:hypothetical protein
MEKKVTAHLPGDKTGAHTHQPAVLQMKVTLTLAGVTPPVWRRFQVRSDTTFYDLHRALQIVMGWGNFHLYMFVVNGVELSDPVTALELGTKNAEQSLLRELLPSHLLQLRYEYDFANLWDHEIELEARWLLPAGSPQSYPRCLAGAGACPPEGSGGSRGYARFLASLNERTRPMQRVTPGQIRPPFEPEAFDVDRVNKVFAAWW